MSKGVTIKQRMVEQFWKALEEYKVAMRGNDGGRIVRATVTLHVAMGCVPKSYKRHVTAACKAYKV